MRADQLARLADLEEKLADEVLYEADPGNWPGAGTPPEDMTKDQRGDRYWCKKNAAATFALLQRTSSLLTDANRPNGGERQDGEDLEKEIAAAEKEAARILDHVAGSARGRS